VIIVPVRNLAIQCNVQVYSCDRHLSKFGHQLFIGCHNSSTLVVLAHVVDGRNWATLWFLESTINILVRLSWCAFFEDVFLPKAGKRTAEIVKIQKYVDIEVYHDFTRCHMQMYCSKHPRCTKTRPRFVLKGAGPENRV